MLYHYTYKENEEWKFEYIKINYLKAKKIATKCFYLAIKKKRIDKQIIPFLKKINKNIKLFTEFSCFGHGCSSYVTLYKIGKFNRKSKQDTNFIDTFFPIFTFIEKNHYSIYLKSSNNKEKILFFKKLLYYLDNI
jgi:tRNA(Phe) wybutosine-synthesizing methylase Tyw3